MRVLFSVRLVVPWSGVPDQTAMRPRSTVRSRSATAVVRNRSYGLVSPLSARDGTIKTAYGARSARARSTVPDVPL